MVYLIIGFGGLFALFWVLALVFATRTVGERSLGIPGFWIVVFGAIAGFGLSKFTEATSNPELLVKGLTHLLKVKKDCVTMKSYRRWVFSQWICLVWTKKS